MMVTCLNIRTAPRRARDASKDESGTSKSGYYQLVFFIDWDGAKIGTDADGMKTGMDGAKFLVRTVPTLARPSSTVGWLTWTYSTATSRLSHIHKNIR